MITSYSQPHWFYWFLWTWDGISKKWNSLPGMLYTNVIYTSPGDIDPLFFVTQPKLFQLFIWEETEWKLVSEEQNWK